MYLGELSTSPICEEECCLMLIEPEETVNTGSAGGELTDTELEWI